MRIARLRWLLVILLCFSLPALADYSGPSIPYGRGNLPAAHTMALLGDSEISNWGLSTACTTNCTWQNSGSYIGWMKDYTTARAGPLATSANGNLTNCGVSGYSVAQILTQVPCVLAANPDIAIVEGGTNDAAASYTCATVTANNRAIYAQLMAAGIVVIKVGVYPRSSPSAYTTAQAQLAQCYNEYDRRFAEENGSNLFYFVDLDPVVVDPTQATWAIKSGYLADGVHCAPLGCSVMGYAIAQVINQLVPNWRGPITSQADIYATPYNPTGNLLPAGLMNGTSGAAQNGCTGTVVGPSAGAVYVDGSSGSGVTCVASTTVLSNGQTAQVITLSGTTTATGTIVFRQLVQTLGNLSVGDVVEAQAWVNYGSNANIQGVALNLTSVESATNYSDITDAQGSYALPTSGLISGPVLLTTPRHTVTAVPTSMYVNVYIYTTAGVVSPSITVTVSAMSLKKVLN